MAYACGHSGDEEGAGDGVEEGGELAVLVAVHFVGMDSGGNGEEEEEGDEDVVARGLHCR